MKIQELLKKFRSGDADLEDVKALYRVLKSGQDPEIVSMIDKEWNSIEDGEGEDERSEVLLREIHEKAGIQDKRKTIYLHLTRILKYAAVFVIAFIISWILKPSGGSDSDSQPNIPKYFSITVPYGSKSTIELPDSSKVILNSGSSLKYPDHFADNDRTVFLRGEAYFDVQKNKQKPFFVKTPDATIKVLGTQFNVKAYPEEKIMETTLVSGSVEILPNTDVYNNKKQVYKRILLKPNEKAVFRHKDFSASPITKSIDKAGDRNALTADIKLQESEKTETDIAWKNDILILSNESFSEIVKKLERWYNVQITMKNDELARVRFSARFNGESISDVLHALSLTQPFYYEINKNKVIILTKKH